MSTVNVAPPADTFCESWLTPTGSRSDERPSSNTGRHSAVGSGAAAFPECDPGSAGVECDCFCDCDVWCEPPSSNALVPNQPPTHPRAAISTMARILAGL